MKKGQKRKLNIELMINALITFILIVLIGIFGHSVQFWLLVTLILLVTLVYITINIYLILTFIKNNGVNKK